MAKGLFRSLGARREPLANCVRYIRRNPEKAGEGEFILYESAVAKGID